MLIRAGASIDVIDQVSSIKDLYVMAELNLGNSMRILWYENGHTYMFASTVAI